MPALTSDETLRAMSSLSTQHPTTNSTAASSRATSPLPIPGRQRAISPSHSRATSPTPGKTKSRRPSISRHHTTNSSFSPPRMDGLLSRVLAEEDKYTSKLREQIDQLATELQVRTVALEKAYARVENTDKRIVETHKKYMAEAAARAAAENEARKAQEETKRLQILLDISRRELERVQDDVERLEAERAEAEGAAGRARAVARELKQTIKVGRAREMGIAEGRAGEDKYKERESQEAIAAAVREAYERGKAEGEASATVKALAAFDKLMESDELAEWDEDAKQSTRQEIKDLSKSPPPSSEWAKSPQPSPPRRKWSIRRGSSNGN